jgi:hypothetical protein
MKIIKIILALFLAFTAIKTNITMLSESQSTAEILGVLTADILFGVIIYFLLRSKSD